MKKKAFEEAGIPVKQISVFQAPPPTETPEPIIIETTSSQHVVLEPPPIPQTSVREPEPEPSTSAIESQANPILLLEQDLAVNDMISDTLTDDKIIFDGENNVDLLADDFTLNPIAGQTEQVLDDGIHTEVLKMDIAEEIGIEWEMMKTLNEFYEDHRVEGGGRGEEDWKKNVMWKFNSM